MLYVSQQDCCDNSTDNTNKDRNNNLSEKISNIKPMALLYFTDSGVSKSNLGRIFINRDINTIKLSPGTWT